MRDSLPEDPTTLSGLSKKWIRTPFYENEPISQAVSAIFFVGLCCYVWFGSLRKGKVDPMDRLVTDERADKLAGAWGRHPLLGRMYLPAYRSDTETVAQLRRNHPAAKVLPALFGCRGLVDIKTVREAITNVGVA